MKNVFVECFTPVPLLVRAMSMEQSSSSSSMLSGSSRDYSHHQHWRENGSGGGGSDQPTPVVIFMISIQKDTALQDNRYQMSKCIHYGVQFTNRLVEAKLTFETSNLSLLFPFTGTTRRNLESIAKQCENDSIGSMFDQQSFCVELDAWGRIRVCDTFSSLFRC